MSKKDDLRNIIADYSQINKSKLWTDIQSVMKCSENEAETLAGSHCNMVSLWALMKVVFDFSVDYQQFFSDMLKKKYTKPNGNGYLLVDPDVICKYYGIDYEPEFFESWADILDPDRLEEGFYECHIKGHFFSMSYFDGEFLGYDTMTRGNPFKFMDKIKPQQFIWIMRVS